MPSSPQPSAGTPGFSACYSSLGPQPALARPDTLAVFDFSFTDDRIDDPRLLRLHLRPLQPGPVCEVWWVDGLVRSGREPGLQWSEGGGWLFAAVEVRDDGRDAATCARQAYGALTAFLQRRPGWHVLRLWNYLDAINQGAGDDERYRQFCAGRMQGMTSYFDGGFPAGTGIGHATPAGWMQVYCLASREAGLPVENPRQLSAWHYPRQYGPVAPSFARAMRLPAPAALAISGTASIRGHASLHAGDLEAQFEETRTNLEALLGAVDMPRALDERALLKVYLRHAEDLPQLQALLDRHLPQAPRLLLQADICRRELLLEIDGWYFPGPPPGPGPAATIASSPATPDATLRTPCRSV